MKICLVIPSLQAGGMERVMSQLSFHFCSRKDIEVHLVIYGKEPEVFYDIPENLVLHSPRKRFYQRFRSFHTILRMGFLRREIRKIDPNAVLSFGEIWNSFVILSLLFLPYPLYISDRCSPERRFSMFHTLLRKFLYPHVTGIIAQTQRANNIYSKKFGHKNISVIGNPIRIILSEANSKIEHERENIVLMVGRFIKSKNQLELIKMFLDIDLQGWKLVLIGFDHLKQNYSDQLVELVNKNNAADRVILTGKLADVDSYYLRSKIFAFTSSSEGFPNVIGEAMSAGLPVVSFDCVAGPSEMITDGRNGYLVPPNDFEMFRERLELLMMDEVLRKKLGEMAWYDIKRFEPRLIGERFLDFILK